jgi:hypothetical protein
VKKANMEKKILREIAREQNVYSQRKLLPAGLKIKTGGTEVKNTTGGKRKA